MHNEQRSRRLTNYAKILFVISIALLVYGIILDINSNQHLIDISNDSDKNIDNGNIVTIDDDEKTKTEDSSAPAEEVTPSSEQDSSSSESPANAEPMVLSIDEQNNQLRAFLQDEYGITIRYGSETIGYSVTSGDIKIQTEPITDSNVINSQLIRLSNALALYPKGLFSEIKNGGIPLTVYLIDHYSNSSVTGITDSSYSFAYISIAAIYPFEESFFHESYHYIERYLFKKNANYNSWDFLNPDGFEYGVIQNDLSYSNTFLPNAYFVNNYAQSTAAEDRASTFEYMMAPSKASCLNQEERVWAKAKYMALTMETTLRSVSPDTVEYWERYL